jgi:UDP-2,3-diacylglucosamine hydrolase
MKQKSLTYFVSDVHLGLRVADPADRERRFVEFLRSLPEETDSLYLLGDIWDFWYEYKHVVPKGYVRVFAALTELIDRGVAVFFFQGNHDVWTYSYFEELGMKKLQQPAVVEIAGKRFCLGHGDGLGPVPLGYRFLRGIFHNRVLQFLFSMLHPWIAFGLGNGWSRSNRLSHDKEYVFKGKDEPLYKFAEDFARENRIDCFVFGHYHSDVHMKLQSGADFIILKDWIHGSPYLCIEG